MFFQTSVFFFNKSYENFTVNNSDQLAMYILETAKVAVVTGNAFGSPNCIRISYASSMEKLKDAMDRIATALNNLV